MLNRIPKPGEFYKHFKGKLYQIITVAIDSETGESMVVYQALYGNYKTYVRPLEMFISKVDTDKYPNVMQTFRFELQQINQEGTIESDTGFHSEEQHNINQQESQIIVDAQEVNPLLLRFLDAETYEKKLQLLLSSKNKMNDRLLEDIATSLDIVLNDVTLEEKYEILKINLQMHQRFECNRLR